MLNIWNFVIMKPIYLYILPIWLMIVVFFIFRKYKKNHKKTNILTDIKKIYKFPSLLFYIENLFVILISIVFFCLLSDPHLSNQKQDVKKNWIDIVLALDISKSMEAEDLRPSRIEAAKSVVNKFIDKLSTDRVGLVIFAGKPYTSVPLTFDYNILKETIENINTDTLNQNVNWLDGTAIWDAILIADNILNSDENKEREKVIILLTDGDANRWVDPILATKSLDNIKIYTIGIWSKQWWRIKYNMWWFTQYMQIPPLNETSLREIANISNGQFFRATDNQTLKNIFEELAKLNKQDIKLKVHKEYITNYKLFTYILIGLMLLYWLNNIIAFKE